jgi:hypothetical protein
LKGDPKAAEATLALSQKAKCSARQSGGGTIVIDPPGGTPGTPILRAFRAEQNLSCWTGK